MMAYVQSDTATGNFTLILFFYDILYGLCCSYRSLLYSFQNRAFLIRMTYGCLFKGKYSVKAVL